MYWSQFSWRTLPKIFEALHLLLNRKEAGEEEGGGKSLASLHSGFHIIPTSSCLETDIWLRESGWRLLLHMPRLLRLGIFCETKWLFVEYISNPKIVI